MNKIFKYVFIGSAVLLLVGVAFKIKAQYKKLMNYCYRVYSFKINSISKDLVDFTLKIWVRNQSDILLTITNYSFDIFMMAKYVSTASNVINQKLYPNTVSTFDVNIKFVPKDVFKAADLISFLSMALANSEEFKIKITGFAGAKAGILSISNIPMSFDYTLKELMTPSDTETTCKV
jgi:LEA14-like dessication related protein